MTTPEDDPQNDQPIDKAEWERSEMIRVLLGIVETCERYDVGSGLTEMARIQIHQEARSVLHLVGRDDA